MLQMVSISMTPPYPHAPYVHKQTLNASPFHPVPLIVHPDCSNASILTFVAPSPYATDNIDTSSYSYVAIHITSHYISSKRVKKHLGLGTFPPVSFPPLQVSSFALLPLISVLFPPLQSPWCSVTQGPFKSCF